MSNGEFLDLDVRPLVAGKQPPLPAILDAVTRLSAGQALRLAVPFEPVPLFRMLEKQGFRHESRTEPDGTWVIIFRR